METKSPMQVLIDETLDLVVFEQECTNIMYMSAKELSTELCEYYAAFQDKNPEDIVQYVANYQKWFHDRVAAS